MKLGKAVLVVAGLPNPLVGPWVPLRGKKWRLEGNPVLAGVSELVVQREGESRIIPLDGQAVEFDADRAQFVLKEKIDGLSRLTVELVEVR